MTWLTSVRYLAADEGLTEIINLCDFSSPGSSSLGDDDNDDDYEQRRQYYQERIKRISEPITVVLPYHRVVEQINYDGDAKVMSIHQMHLLDLWDNRVSITFRNIEQLRFDMSNIDYDALLAGYRDGTIELHLNAVVSAYSDYGTEFCQNAQQDLSGREFSPREHYAVDLDLLQARFVDSDETSWAVTETALGRRLKVQNASRYVREAITGAPHVEVKSLKGGDKSRSIGVLVNNQSSVTHSPICPKRSERDKDDFYTELEVALMPCYLSALSTNSGIQGAMVVRMELDDERVINAVEILIDTLHNKRMTQCVSDTLQTMQDSLVLPGEDKFLKATLLFKRR